MIKFNKKADMDVSMSWIFMMIVGVVFIVLAYNIVSKYQENEENKYEIELKQSLRSILNFAGRTTGTEENKLTPAGKMFAGKTVEVKCIADIPTLWIDNGKIADTENQFLSNYPVFMTNIGDSKTDDVYIAVESFRMPFKVTNMVAITSKKNLIVFDKNSKITKKYLYKFNKGSYKNLHYKADWDMITGTDFQNLKDYVELKNLDSIVIVMDKTPTAITSAKLAELKVPAYLVQIEESNLQGDYGTIIYLDKSGTSSSFKYIDNDKSLGLITMAVFSNPESFKCSYNKIINLTPEVYNYYIAKTTYLHNIGKDDLICSSSILHTESSVIGYEQQYYYASLNTTLTNIKNEVSNQKFNNVANINTLLVELNGKFKQLEKFNCPYIY